MNMDAHRMLKDGKVITSPSNFVNCINKNELFELFKVARINPVKIFKNLNIEKQKWCEKLKTSFLVPNRIFLIKKIMDADIISYLIKNDIYKDHLTDEIINWAPFPFDDGAIFFEYFKKRFHTGTNYSKTVFDSYFQEINELIDSLKDEPEINAKKSEIDSILNNLFREKRNPKAKELNLLKSKNGKVYLSTYLKQYKEKYFPELTDKLIKERRLSSNELIKIMEPPSEFIANNYIQGFISSIKSKTDYFLKIYNKGYEVEDIQNGTGEIIIFLNRKS